jgi:hypothetical protein
MVLKPCEFHIVRNVKVTVEKYYKAANTSRETLFRSIIVLCGTNIIPRTIPWNNVGPT